ncbi:MAG: carboxy-S-adenosyl-L-methionine synthase CmoA [Gemmatimonadota bacterium]
MPESSSVQEDRIFDHDREPSDFEFGDEVVAVFDDMVNRSVPFYSEIQRMLAELSRDWAAEGTRVYDLGVSTGNTLLAMDPFLDGSIGFVGVDDSEEMLAQCREKLDEAQVSRPVDLTMADIGQGISLQNASVVILCLTLQFIRPIHRERLIRSIYEQVNEGGCLLLVEKLLCGEPVLNRRYIKYYYDFKRRRKYSEMEIAQKREALENVLIPYTLEENQTLLRDCGFRSAETFFRWYNFAGIIALK